MSATSLQVVTLDIANPEYGTPDYNPERVNGSISFNYLASFDMTTLSSRGAQSGSKVQGLLYVVEPRSSQACMDASRQYIPENVTRLDDLPDLRHDTIGLAPWLSPECVESTLEMAAVQSVGGMLFYLPQENTTVPPPDGDSSTWSLGDNSNLQQRFQFPIYVVPGQTGNILMNQSALYSGNLSSAPFADALADEYDRSDYIRLSANIDTGGGSSLPSLWVFLLVVLAILFSIIAATSISMHWLQRRRRRDLRQRVANGEVDLEALGIKRLTVPQHQLDKMPLYTYGSGTPVQQSSLARENNASSSVARDKLNSTDSSRPASPEPNVRPTAAMTRSDSYHPTPLDQPTCAICLDDFVPAGQDTPTGRPAEPGTTVRELPCHHIFHPECVDSFLRDSSSLCPICKRSALPKGYCPRNITNAMVRRERMLRRMPDAGESGDVPLARLPPAAETNVDEPPSGRFSRLSALGHRISSAPARHSQAQPMSEPQRPDPALSRSNTAGSASRAQRTVQPADSATRREWARRRAEQMLGRRAAPLDPDEEDAARTPGWKKALRGVFPGFGGVGRRGRRRQQQQQQSHVEDDGGER